MPDIVPDDVRGMTDQEVGLKHRNEVLKMIEDEGKPWFRIDFWTAMNLREKHRLEWVLWTRHRDGESQVDPSRRKDKSDKISAFVNNNIGLRRTPSQIAESVGCSPSTVYEYMADHPGTFRMVARGTYELVDATAERAAAKSTGSAPTIAQDRSAAPNPIRTANDADAALRALDAMNGAQPNRPVRAPGKP